MTQPNPVLAAENYQPLSPYKFLRHKDRLQQFFNDPFEISPITAHLVPTLYCNQRCYFCTYGQYKENGKRSGLQMKLDDLKQSLDQLAGCGIKGVIFTGGGEPTVYPHLVEAMTYAKEKGMDIALNTNGYQASDALLDGVLNCKPRYIRISFNNGSAVTQRLVTGRDNFKTVLHNIQRWVERKIVLSPATDISIGYVVNVVNLHEMPDFLSHMLQIEKKVIQKTGVENPIYSLQFRPVSNFDHGKHTSDSKRMRELADYLQAVYGDEYRVELENFLYQNQQTSPTIMQRALETIQYKLIPELSAQSSRINIIYPEQKFIDLIAGAKKPYAQCLSCPWYLFIWSDGSLYSCVEWAGDPEFSIGNIFTDPLTKVLFGGQRRKVLEAINQNCIHQRCVPVCAHHEMNILLNQLLHLEPDQIKSFLQDAEQQTHVRHENFL